MEVEVMERDETDEGDEVERSEGGREEGQGGIRESEMDDGARGRTNLWGEGTEMGEMAGKGTLLSGNQATHVDAEEDKEGGRERKDLWGSHGKERHFLGI
ncbi:hypothetical protein Pmani_036533 [Petrolisthes manimaculis]|uniref:Uncharacterized protein n=1 Tax=Petrolisthes manimaculis TaxID=1843537 RepID=A0AAE1NJJ2_9EUCA|nr:hypothetical protein Pmani_036533 [Petrolisthes manimaculis]